MDLKSLIDVLDKNNDANLHIKFTSGDSVPDHFHVTEVGKVTKKFVDCGGVLHESSFCSLQVWTANDVDHRLVSSKLSKILKMAISDVGIEKDLEVEIEYGGDVISQYSISGVESDSDGILFLISGKQTNCLAPDKCGLNVLCQGNDCC